MPSMNSKTTEEIALGIRRRVFLHTLRHNGGYLSQACSAAESLAMLYNEILQLGAPTLPGMPLPFRGVPSADNPESFTGAGYQFTMPLEASPEHDSLVLHAKLTTSDGRAFDASQIVRVTPSNTMTASSRRAVLDKTPRELDDINDPPPAPLKAEPAELPEWAEPDAGAKKKVAPTASGFRPVPQNFLKLKKILV